jgi:hypothetical protein
MNKPKPVKGNAVTPGQKQKADNRSAEQRLLDCLVEPLRTTDEREQSRTVTHESHEVIEQMLGSPMVLSGIAKAQNAFVVEHWPRLLRELFDAAKERQAWAWKILLDVAGVAEQLRIASGEMDSDLRAELDRSLPEEIRTLMRRTDAESSHSDSPEAEP